MWHREAWGRDEANTFITYLDMVHLKVLTVFHTTKCTVVCMYVSYEPRTLESCDSNDSFDELNSFPGSFDVG